MATYANVSKNPKKLFSTKRLSVALKYVTITIADDTKILSFKTSIGSTFCPFVKFVTAAVSVFQQSSDDLNSLWAHNLFT